MHIIDQARALGALAATCRVLDLGGALDALAALPDDDGSYYSRRYLTRECAAGRRAARAHDAAADKILQAAGLLLLDPDSIAGSAGWRTDAKVAARLLEHLDYRIAARWALVGTRMTTPA